MSIRNLSWPVGMGLLLLFASAAPASVVMTGTRVIYTAKAPEKTIQLTNNDDRPNLMQVWVDKGNPDSTIEKADAPFVVTPQIFRMEPRNGQMVRLIFAGGDLPQDRESLFYLNFSQFPAVKIKDEGTNKLVLMIRNRIKLFYRPAGLAGSPPGDVPRQLVPKLHAGPGGASVQVDNPTPYYAVVRSAQWAATGKNLSLGDAAIIPPLSHVAWSIPPGVAPHSSGDILKLVLVNDYGGDITHEYSLQ
ncbi:fimbrial biogenesis chaperone [Frateuria defendens]|uniref:fimbrial biogenesis chaperone n=1 Tax=Frateuria defendens TaxID=2219559 RepID=UPI00066FB5F1|nr:molecular chaperone [Frateuria defendens]